MEDKKPKLKWHTEQRKIDALIPFEKNPRKITDQQKEDLRKSLEKFDLVEIPAIDTDNKIVAGHQRLGILKLLGKGGETIDVRMPNRKLTDEEFKEYNLRSNKNTGEWDYDLLGDMGENILSEVGFGSDELDMIFGLDEQGDIDKVSELPEEPKSRMGDIYQLGEHRLMCGDATKKEDVEKLMGGKKANMVFTDPPYGLGGYGGRKKMELKGDNEDVQKFYDSIPHDIEERYIWGNIHNVINLHDKPRDVIVWVKNNFGLGKGYRGQYELCFYYGNFRGSDSDVWNINKDIKYQHPTQKPVALAKRAIKNSSKREQIVLDLFGGSGSTLIACEQLNRKCSMMEIDPKYCDVIIERWENITNKKAIKTVI